jgi:3-dehydroquinate dehydratase I
MRVPSSVQVVVRGAVLGGPRPLVCLPLLASRSETLLAQAGQLAALGPDLIEWRIDGYREVEDLNRTLRLLRQVRQRIGDLPLLFTCRMAEEGGLASLKPAHRLELLTAAIVSGDIDIVDCELANQPEFLAIMKNTARRERVPLLLSYHNFQTTPPEETLLATIERAGAAGAEIVKVAVMPRDAGDVLTLLQVTHRARNDLFPGPLVTVAMGKTGIVTRLAGGVFGSDMTFAAGFEASAPGQIPFAPLRQAMDLLYAP